MSKANLKKLGQKLEKFMKKAEGEDWDEFWSENGAKLVKDIAPLVKTKGGKTKKKKDPNAPAAALNNYMLFCKDKRPEVKEKFSELKGKEITKKIGEMWKALSDKEKEVYTQKAKKEKERFTEEMKSYTPPEGDDEEDGEAEVKKPKKKAAPKKAAAKPKKEAAKKAPKKEEKESDAEELEEDDE